MTKIVFFEPPEKNHFGNWYIKSKHQKVGGFWEYLTLAATGIPRVISGLNISSIIFADNELDAHLSLARYYAWCGIVNPCESRMQELLKGEVNEKKVSVNESQVMRFE